MLEKKLLVLLESEVLSMEHQVTTKSDMPIMNWLLEDFTRHIRQAVILHEMEMIQFSM